jgi:tight adherence protein B
VSTEAIIMLVAGAVVLTTCLLVYLVLAPEMAKRARVKRRVSLVTRRAEGGRRAASGDKRGRGSKSRQRDIQVRLRQAEDARSKKESVAQRYRKMMRMAGLRITPQQFLLMCSGLGVVTAVIYIGIAYLSGMPVIATIPVGITLGFGVPWFVVRWLGKRRVNRFTLLFADAVDVIVRGVRSGLPVGECLNIIAAESPQPVAGVFQEIVDAMRLGMNIEQALLRAQEAMPTAEIRFFSIVLSIQSQTGGNLAETLSNLSSVLRARKKMRDKVDALSSEARTSAMIIGSLPFLITLVLTFVNFKYINLLFTDDLGHILIAGSLIWMSLGVFIMKQMINFEI